jgi:outer membrane protein OmpA-like peptidoglycan-associated protein
MRTIFSNKETEEHWISISDMMSALMIIFMFIAISYMLTVQNEKEKIKQIAVTYNELQSELYDDLYNEFKNDLPEWKAVIDKSTLSIRFQEPDILFGVGSSNINYKFKQILNDFFPRYINILTNDKYKDEIAEIRIEGHTSSEWYSRVSKEDAYYNNMKLSQDRTRSVLEYVLRKDKVNGEFQWLKSKVTANGLSSSKLIYSDGGNENKELSRRVEFRVRTNAERRIVNILEELK